MAKISASIEVSAKHVHDGKLTEHMLPRGTRVYITDVGVDPPTLHTTRREDADSEHKISQWLTCSGPNFEDHRLTAGQVVALLARAIQNPHRNDLSLSRTPA